MTKRIRWAALAAAGALALTVPASAAAAPSPPMKPPPTMPTLDPIIWPAQPAVAVNPAAAVTPDVDLPIQPSDIALSFPDQPGTGVVLTDAGSERAAIRAAGGAAAWAKQKAKADAVMADIKAGKIKIPTPRLDSAPSGHQPYGGDMWSGGTPTHNVSSCTGALATRATSGAQYFLTAGHCVRLDGVHDDINATNGVFCGGWIQPCPSIDIGNTGHGGTCVGSNVNCGDRTFIRANKAWLGNGLRAEVRTWDSRVTVGVTTIRNPVYGESASASGGMSHRLNFGQVLVTGQPIQFAPPAPVIYVAVMRSTTQVGPGGCTIEGDSGGTIIASDHAVIGMVSGHAIDNGYCWIYFGKAGTAAQQTAQVPAPLP